MMEPDPMLSREDFLMEELKNQEVTEMQMQAIEAATNFRDKTIAVLRTVRDPEIPVNIWDLGLVYRLDVNDHKDISVDVTLTAPTCPVADAIPGTIEARLKSLIPEHGEIKVLLVWEPQWDREMMSEEARLVLDMW